MEDEDAALAHMLATEIAKRDEDSIANRAIWQGVAQATEVAADDCPQVFELESDPLSMSYVIRHRQSRVQVAKIGRSMLAPHRMGRELTMAVRDAVRSSLRELTGSEVYRVNTYNSMSRAAFDIGSRVVLSAATWERVTAHALPDGVSTDVWLVAQKSSEVRHGVVRSRVEVGDTIVYAVDHCKPLGQRPPREGERTGPTTADWSEAALVAWSSWWRAMATTTSHPCTICLGTGFVHGWPDAKCTCKAAFDVDKALDSSIDDFIKYAKKARGNR